MIANAVALYIGYYDQDWVTDLNFKTVACPSFRMFVPNTETLKMQAQRGWRISQL